MNILITLNKMFQTKFKYANQLGRFFALACLLVFAACSQDPWSEEEKQEKFDECMEESDSKSYCDCYVGKLMEKYPLAENADKISFEEAVEIGKTCE